jgi:hypothetical protein
MAASRRARVPKSPVERTEYQQNVIRPKDRESPTVERLQDPDSTDSIAAGIQASNEPLAELRPTARPWRLEAKTWAQEHALELVTSLFGLALLYLGSQFVALNREVGELKQRLEAVEKTSYDKAGEERVQHQLDRLQDRLDGLARSGSQQVNGPTTQSPKPPKSPRSSARPIP